MASGLFIAAPTRHLPVLKHATIAWAVAVTPVAAFFVYAAIRLPWAEASFVGQVGAGLATAGLFVAAASSALGARVLKRAQGAA